MLNSVEVNGLFGRFDYRIGLQPEGITVLTGPNGFGKSTLFSLIDAVSKCDSTVYRRTPFESLRLEFSDGKACALKKTGGSIYLNGVELSADGGVSAEEKTAARSLGPVRLIGSRRLFDSAMNDEAKLAEYIAAIKSIPARLGEKLSAGGDGTESRAGLFKRLLTDKLAFKTPVTDKAEGLYFLDGDGGRLAFTDLSAGEMQITAFYYELLFECPGDALLLMDEPEISMHIVWQLGLIDDLKAILSALGSARAVIATHSPQILGGHRDLQVDLGEQYER